MAETARATRSGTGGRSEVYRRRRPERTVLHRLVRTHLETYLARAQEADPLGDGVPRFVEAQFRAYLRCGILAHGFARARCSGCGHDFLVAFSCKGRGICPSCNSRRMAATAAHLTDHVIPAVPVRQWVLSVPKRLRYFLHRDPEPIGAPARERGGPLDFLSFAQGRTETGTSPRHTRARRRTHLTPESPPLDPVVRYTPYLGDEMENLTTGELAESAGVNVQTVRYYERRGLLPEPPRSPAGYRLYGHRDLRRLRFIRRAKTLGFQLSEIEDLLDLSVGEDGSCGAVVTRAEAAIARVDEQIEQLSRMRKTLMTMLKACREQDPTGDCPILESLESEEAE